MTHPFAPLFYDPSECHDCGQDRASHDLSRATQARQEMTKVEEAKQKLCDAAVAYAVARTRWLSEPTWRALCACLESGRGK